MIVAAQAPATDGRATRWSEHRVTRRAELLRAARHAVHDVGPEVSMEEIAARAGTSKPVLYRYFTDKSGLQTAVGQVVLSRMRDALEEAARGASGPRERIAAMVGVYLEMVDASPNVYAFVTRPGAGGGELGGFVAEVIDLVAEAVRPALPEGDERSVAALRLWAAGVVGLVRGAVEEWLESPGVLRREDLTAQLTTWLWDGAAGVLRRARAAAGAGEDRREP